MKYVIDKFYGPIVFTGNLSHKEVAEKLGFRAIQSAGFVKLGFYDEENEILCYGDSFTLNVKSQYGDSQIIEEFLRRET